MDWSYKAVIEENDRRLAALNTPYEPITGLGSPIERVPVSYFVRQEQWSYAIPVKMYEDYKELFDFLNEHGSVEKLLSDTDEQVNDDLIDAFVRGLTELRFKYDFEFWAFTTAKIQDKETKALIPFYLNQPQRKILKELEDMRIKGIPIRLILLKARQYGGSTLIEIYFAWMQNIVKMNWHAAVIAAVDDQARNIRGMYSRFAKEYPREVGTVTLKPYESSSKNKLIVERNCIIGVGSAETPDNFRSFDFAMLHLSEIGLYKSTPQKSAEDLVQSVKNTVPDVPDTIIVLESTAKGVGNYFHREWQNAINGNSYYRPVFVGWHEIERYQKTIKNHANFYRFLMSNDYAKFLWESGATMEGIKWYFDYKKGENYDDWRMKSEYPTTHTEAFQSTGRRVFHQSYVLKARRTCTPPSFIGEISGKGVKGKKAFEDIRFITGDKGLLSVWAFPDKSIKVSDRYAVIVDIGGRTENADWSTIKVLDRYWMMDSGKPEVVALWRGHIDQDLVAWKAAQIAKIYNDALLVVECNSLDSEESEGEHHLTVLDEIVEFYQNIYARTEPDKVRQGLPVKYGFHTNRSTKPMVIDELNGVLRDELYVERDLMTCDEMDTYEIKKNGSYGAVEGCHDDLVIVTAIGCWVCFKYLPLPKLLDPSHGKKLSKKILSEASM